MIVQVASSDFIPELQVANDACYSNHGAALSANVPPRIATTRSNVRTAGEHEKVKSFPQELFMCRIVGELHDM